MLKIGTLSSANMPVGGSTAALPTSAVASGGVPSLPGAPIPCALPATVPAPTW
jgi:hypothetical protein